ncbi:tektin-3-like isoform X2 [Apis dorsata]|uniref:tektin-3-like isoform X2 n=1 Tax=Apis dorsata TaxID=7462 RepID=UPI0003DF7AF4|nr:tektin-3-like isoform X2 [Apis dorsata]
MQLQSWSTFNLPISYVEPITLRNLSNYANKYNSPWYSKEYNNIEIIPLTKSTSNYTLDIPNTISSSRFPDLKTKYEHNAQRGSKTILHTRYTPDEWYQKQIKYYNDANSCRYFSERTRNEALQIIRDAEEKIQSGQYDTDRRLGERINDINFWRNEIASELERLVQEIERLNDCNSVLNKAIKDIENPLRIAEECLYYREARKDTELVHDDSEKCLAKEIEILNQNRTKLEICLDKCKNQLQDCRFCQCQLELNLKCKENALQIDRMCHQLNNYSSGLQYYIGIEKYNSCLTEQNTWIHDANQIIEKSQTERNKSCQLRTNAEALMIKITQEMWDAWSNTNTALTHRSSELLEAKNKLQQHLQMVQQEIFNVEKSLELMHKAIADKSHVSKVAYTRLQTRTHRPDIEHCRDYAHMSLQKEIDEINHQMERMYSKLKELENQHQNLLKAQTTLEHDLALKIDAIHIDQEKVSSLRRAYPINILFKF